MTLPRVAITLVIAALLVPVLSFAQSSSATSANDAALRATIRADIMKDPRTSTMSSTQIDAMVDALAQQAEAQGSAQDYLDAQNSFKPAEAPFYNAAEPDSTSNALAISVFALLAVLGLVAIFLIWHRNMRRHMPPSAA